MTDPTTAEFTITRMLDAPRDLVWRAWTEEDELTHWLHPGPLSTPRESLSFDVREGGRLQYTMVYDETGDEFPAGGVFLEVVPIERLVFTWSQPADKSDRAPIATVTFAERGDQTEMVFTLRGAAGQPGDEGVYDGWDSAFDNLSTYLADRHS